MKIVLVIEVGFWDFVVLVILDEFMRLFNEFDKGNLNRLFEVYSEDI